MEARRVGGQGAEVRRFTPLPKQRVFLEATEEEVLYSGAWGAGKSRVGCEKGHFLSMRYPGNRGLIVRKVFRDLPGSTLISLFEDVLPPEHIIEHHKTLHRVIVRSDDARVPSEIWYAGLDRVTSIGSTEFGWIFADESVEFEEEDWDWLTGRLRLTRVPFRQIFTATNPGAPTHWLYRRFYEERPLDERAPCACGAAIGEPCATALQHTRRPARRVVDSNALENPHLPADYRIRLNRLTGVHAARYRDGKWVGYQGLVFPNFDPRVHVVDPFPIPSNWTRYRSFDFGTANPFVCGWWASDPRDGTLYLYRQIYMTGRRASDHARQVVQLSAGERITASVSDHDLGDRMDLEAAGIETIPANKDIHEGIQALANRLGDPHGSPPQAPRLFIFRDSLVEEDPHLVEQRKPTCTEAEPGGYVWAKGAHGVVKDVPLDKDNHGMDMARYLVMLVDRGGEPGGVW